MNTMRTKASDKVFTANDLLESHYGDVSITQDQDPDLGAICDVEFRRSE